MGENLVFNIQRYSLNDGEGIRTIVFLKGCPLRCPWCSNPESQSFEREVFRRQKLCINCNSKDIFSCGIAPNLCPTNAKSYIGDKMSIEEIVEEVKKDKVFYETTGGGITISGGEPLSQGRFLVELLKAIKDENIHTAMETSGFGSLDTLDKAANYLDQILFDLKIMDREKAKTILNVDMDIVKENFKYLVKKDKKIIPRIPLIPGFTMDKQNIDDIISFVVKNNLKEVHMLPFHQYGSSKYEALGLEYKLIDLKPPNDEKIQEIKEYMEKYDLKVIIGG